MKRIVLLVASLWLVTSSLHAKIVFESNRDGNDEIYTMNSDGSNQTRLTFNEASDSSPDWSPNGRQIAFVSKRDRNKEVYVMGADGSNPRNLTRHPALDMGPCWSPDGRQIAFHRFQIDGNGGSPFKLLVMDGHGGNVREVGDAWPVVGLNWSPDGQWILFKGYGPLDGFQSMPIYAIRPNGRDLWRVASPKPGKTILLGGWSPDGNRVLHKEIVKRKNDSTYFLVITTLHPAKQRLVMNQERVQIPEIKFSGAVFGVDGQSILFQGWKDGDGEKAPRHIYRYRLATRKLIQLTDNNFSDSAPQEWNPRLSVPAQQRRLLLYWGAIKSNRK
jgi:Tol biopolymer transport system component